MTDPEFFRVPVVTTMVERVCAGCHKGFYRATGQTLDLVAGPKQVLQHFVHQCPTCGDTATLDLIYPQIRYDSEPDLNWADPAIRETWKKEQGIEN